MIAVIATSWPDFKHWAEQHVVAGDRDKLFKCVLTVLDIYGEEFTAVLQTPRAKLDVMCEALRIKCAERTR